MLVTVKGKRPIDTYDAIDLLLNMPWAPQPVAMVANAAKRVADIWNDLGSARTAAIAEEFPELADALYELLAGGPCTPPIMWADVREVQD